MQKYRNRPTTMNGKRFDSGREAKRFAELQLLERAGKISDLRRQVPFELIPAQYEEYTTYTPKKRLPKVAKRCVERSVVYRADFVYRLPDGREVVEDAKGCRTDEYIIKRKLMLYVHGIRVSEV